MAQTLQLKRETATWWTTNNPTLAAGEPGFETDTDRLKVGDGSTAWNSLDYVSSWPLSQAIALGATTPVPGGIGARRWSTTTGCELVWDGAAWIVPSEGVQRVVLGSDRTSTVVTAADVTGLSFAVKAGVQYHFEFSVLFQSATLTTGIALSIDGPASPTLLAYNVVIPISDTSQVVGNRRAYNTLTVGTAVNPINANYRATISGTIQPSADGTLIVRFASEIASTSVVVKAGSYGFLRALSNGGNVASNPAIAVVTIAGTTHTLSPADQGVHFKYTSSSAVTVTVPATLPQGFHSRHSQRSTGAVSFVHATDTNKIRKRATLQRTTAGVDATATLLTDGADEHLLEGDLLPV
jgi:Major tropism determinant N-terminal domain